MYRIPPATCNDDTNGDLAQLQRARRILEVVLRWPEVSDEERDYVEREAHRVFEKLFAALMQIATVMDWLAIGDAASPLPAEWRSVVIYRRPRDRV